MRNSRRVVVTGLGVVAPNGIGKETFWQNLIAGKSAIDYITAFDPTPYPCHVAGEVRDFDPKEFMHVRRTKHRGRFSQFAVAAAKLALSDSRIEIGAEHQRRVVACLGTSMNGAGDIYEAARVAYDREGVKGIPMMSGIEFAAHAPVSHVSSELGIRGQGMTLASACATGLDAIQWGVDQIREDRADVVFAGSTEAPISEFCFATLCALGALSKFDDPPLRASRPYDRRRDGLVLGEGAAICVLEEHEHAIERGATVYAEVLGYGTGNEGGFGAKINAAELALTEAINTALTTAGKSPSDIDYINAHGNSLPDYDLIETRAFRAALGRAAYSVPTSSIKSMIGHAMGAASAFQVISSCLTLEHSLIPPTINYEVPDPECDLDYVPNEARASRARTVLINAHAMGGTHSVLILGKQPA
ncbi:MAG TPA: beta-ketoacyl-[acyl-carrier-protein] synthase family protein [Methylomirabilota bacterium]|nr:beta-ketoacyl-[acyl-carrier-protein] synthase family protein [Methylomirabilota bacterium]